ncbi:TPA: hypothetical protein HA234_01170 [Candidatus Woesearchaeota archaeon]|nr:hypothetical protein [Candidatus Woesearchaeota archaeon]HIG92789.1 hypothetical protein [Candidatus Woesearchaeota archaeon]
MATPFTLRVEDVVYTTIEREGIPRPQRPDDRDLVEKLLKRVDIERTTIDGQVAFSWHPEGYFLLNPTERSGIVNITRSSDGYNASHFDLKKATPLFCEVDSLSEGIHDFREKYRILFSHTPPEKL